MCSPGFRHPIRHPSHDTAGPGVWFITINTRDSALLFGQVVDGRMYRNALGGIVWDAWNDLPLHFAHVASDSFVVMPNHFHGVLRLVACDLRANCPQKRIERYAAPVVGSVATIIRSFKSGTTRAIRQRLDERITVWQSRFYDRRLWDQRALDNARTYIADNPMQWVDKR